MKTMCFVFLVFLLSIQCAGTGRSLLIHGAGAGRGLDEGVKMEKACWFCCLYPPHCPPPHVHIASTTTNPSPQKASNYEDSNE
jgi:hypothetical protein